MTHPYFDLPLPLVLGHRGAAGDAPENTLLSFERALELGADILETDVRATADEEPILMHDAVLDRITNGSGRVEERTLAEIKELDAGYRFSIEERGDPRWLPGPEDHYRGQGLRVPTLEEAFEAFPGARFNLEIKARSPALIAEVVALVRKFDREDLTLLTAGDDAIMEVLREEIHRSGVAPAIGASAADVLGVAQSALAGCEPPAGAMVLQIPPSFAGEPLVTRELVDHSHRHGIQVHAWTVNALAEMERLLELGVDGLVTDFPARAIALAARRGRPGVG